MKVVKITRIIEDGNSYKVCLGNGTVHHFTRERNAKDFLGNTNKFLTAKLYESRDLFTATWQKYQASWGYFENDKKSKKSEMRESDRECRQLLDSCEEAFNSIVQRSWFTNGNYFVFHHFNRVIENLMVVIKQLNIICKKHSITHELYTYDNLFKRLQTLSNEINTYGQLEAHSLFKMPQHIDMEKEFIPQIPQLKVA